MTTLTQLKKQLAAERKKTMKVQAISKTEYEKKRLQSELYELQNPTKARIKRGAIVLGKKLGSGIKAQAIAIKKRQMQQSKSPRRKSRNYNPMDIDF